MRWYQEIKNQEIPGTRGTANKEESRWLPLRMYRTPDSYSPSYIQATCIADLKTAEALRFIVENLDAGKIRKFGVATLYVVTVYQLWTKELMILRGASFAATAIISAQNAVHAILTGTVTAQTIAYKALKIQVAFTTTAMKALNFIMKKNPLILFATLVATAGAALLTFGGFLDDTTKKLDKEDEALIKAGEAAKEYGDKVDKANKKLEDKIKLLQASEIQKFAIENDGGSRRVGVQCLKRTYQV